MLAEQAFGSSRIPGTRVIVSAVTVLLFEGIVHDNGPVTALVTGDGKSSAIICHESGSGMASWTFARVGTG